MPEIKNRIKEVEVEYSHLVSSGYPTFSNTKVGHRLRASVEEGEDPLKVAEDLYNLARDETHKKLGVPVPEVKKLQMSIDDLKELKATLEDEIVRLKRKFKSFLSKTEGEGS